MLYPGRVTQQLEASVGEFRAFVEDERLAFRAFDGVLANLHDVECAEISRRLSSSPRPGALLTSEWDAGTELVLRFSPRFANHRVARQWALARIANVTTVAVDGSEIKPTKDYSLPVAAVQIAWFENPHRADRRHVKDVEFEVLDPGELARDPGDGFGVADQLIALRRFQAEARKLAERMTRLADRGWPGPPPVAFFDGSLVVSFAAQMIENVGAKYIEAICELVRVSEQTRVPLVGFVDTSMSKDLATMLSVVGNLPRADRVPDGRLIDSRMSWGDRTRSLICARDDVLRRYQLSEDLADDFSREVCFVYLKTNGAAPPARLDFPHWILRDGLLDHVLDVVRAEVIVGNGYPYCIEAADACAVLSSLDREHFYRLLQDFARASSLGLRIVPKAASKRRRRL